MYIIKEVPCLLSEPQEANKISLALKKQRQVRQAGPLSLCADCVSQVLSPACRESSQVRVHLVIRTLGEAHNANCEFDVQYLDVPYTVSLRR